MRDIGTIAEDSSVYRDGAMFDLEPLVDRPGLPPLFGG